jgi:hypothetical protein
VEVQGPGRSSDRRLGRTGEGRRHEPRHRLEHALVVDHSAPEAAVVELPALDRLQEGTSGRVGPARIGADRLVDLLQLGAAVRVTAQRQGVAVFVLLHVVDHARLERLAELLAQSHVVVVRAPQRQPQARIREEVGLLHSPVDAGDHRVLLADPSVQADLAVFVLIEIAGQHQGHAREHRDRSHVRVGTVVGTRAEDHRDPVGLAGPGRGVAFDRLAQDPEGLVFGEALFEGAKELRIFLPQDLQELEVVGDAARRAQVVLEEDRLRCVEVAHRRVEAGDAQERIVLHRWPDQLGSK